MVNNLKQNCNLEKKRSSFFATKLTLAGKFCAVATAFAIPMSTTLTNILFIVTPLLVIVSGDLRRKFKMIFQNRIAVLFLIFFALFVLGLFYTTASFEYAFGHLIKYDKFLFAVFFIPLFKDEKWRNYAIYAFLFAVGIMLMASYLRYFDIFYYANRRTDDLVEVFKGHIAFSFLMSFGAYLAMQYLFIVKSNFSRVLLSVFLLLIFYNIFFLGMGRSGYFVLAGLISLFCVQKLNIKGLMIAAVSVAILSVIAFTFSGMFQERIKAMMSDIKTYSYNPNAETSVGLRMSFVANSIKLIKAHPIIGTGTGSIKNEYADLKPTPKFLTDNPHNEYLNVAVQLGFVGLLFLLSLFYSQLVKSRHLSTQMRDIAQATVIAIAIGCFANSWLMDVTQGHFYAYFSMLTFAALQCQKKTV